MKNLALGLLLGASAPAFAQDQNLIGGTPADPKDWPASVYASMNNASCSATVVGEKVLLIAAHCVSNGGKASFSIGPNRYTSTCTHSPDYRRDDTADWALCVVDRPVTGIKYEVLATEAAVCQAGQKLMLTGYGCTRPGGGGGNDGVYRIGEATINRCPDRDNDIVTKGSAALCYGDSGGPAFKVESDGKRKLVSVNSRGDIRTTSYLSAIFTDKAKAFIADWSSRNQLKICGVHADAKDCRDAVQPDPEPSDDCLKELGIADKAFDELKACMEAKI